MRGRMDTVNQAINTLGSLAILAVFGIFCETWFLRWLGIASV